jgi:NitT/TauT family transport system permease protein
MDNLQSEFTAPKLENPVKKQSRRDAWLNFLLPTTTFILVLIVWEILVVRLEVPAYIMPPPSVFLQRVVEDRALLWDHAMRTAYEVLVGFLLATVISIPLGFIIASSKTLERTLYPIIVFIQLIPKIAIAPLFIVWFGFGIFPKVLITFLLCFFPTLVASLAGYDALDQRVLYLTRSMGATRLQTFRYVRIPSAMPFIFAGLKVSIVFASTGAIVGEFVGANKGLGYLLLRGSSYLDTSLIFAVLVVLSIMGLAFSYGVQFLEKIVMPWQGKEVRS